MAESEEELRGEWKGWLETQHSKTKIMASGPITSWQIYGGKMETVTDFIFLGSKITASVTAAMKLKDACSLEAKLWQTKTAYFKKRYYFANKGPFSQRYGFSSSHVWRVGPQRRLNTDELMLLNCGAREDSWESLGLQGDQTSQS